MNIHQASKWMGLLGSKRQHILAIRLVESAIAPMSSHHRQLLLRPLLQFRLGNGYFNRPWHRHLHRAPMLYAVVIDHERCPEAGEISSPARRAVEGPAQQFTCFRIIL